MSSGPAAADLPRNLGDVAKVPESVAGVSVGTWLRVAILSMLGLAILPLDRTLIAWIGKDCLPGELEVLLHRVEPFGHAYGVLFIVLTLWIVARADLRQIGLLFGCSLGAGILADVVKLFVARYRPSALPDGLTSTFLGLRPIWDPNAFGDLFNSDHHSFPSAHTATAFGLAIALGHLYPKGRTWFLTLAILVAFQRVAFGYHYPSDTFVGAAIGILAAGFMMRWMRVGEPNSTSRSSAA
ncbi:MAG: phosphatase PAP2 family protein [Planctomycetota bacterium]